MKGKTLDSESAKQIIEQRRAGKDAKVITSQLGETGSGDWWDESRATDVSDTLEAIMQELKGDSPRINQRTQQIFDSKACEPVHKGLALDPDLISNDGFWRWIAVDKFYKVIEARMNTSQNDKNFGIDGISDHRIAILWYRADLFLDPKADDPYHLAKMHLRTDFVESGIARVRYGWSRNLARAFVRFQYPNPESDETYLNNGKEGVRMLYKRLRQAHSTASFEYYDEEEITQILFDQSEDLLRA